MIVAEKAPVAVEHIAVGHMECGQTLADQVVVSGPDRILL